MREHPPARCYPQATYWKPTDASLCQTDASFSKREARAVGKRGRIWWMHFMVDGRRVQKSTGCTRRRDAEEYKYAYRTRLAKGEVGFAERKPAPRFKEAMAEFLERSEMDHEGKANTQRRAVTSS